MSRGRGLLFAKRENDFGNKTSHNHFGSSREAYNNRSDEVEHLRQPFNSQLNVSKPATGCSEWDDWDREAEQTTNQPYVLSSNCEDDDPHDMKISSRHVGLVIGKGGSRIKELQQSSGAKIDIQRNSDGCEMVTISLSGDSESRLAAKKLIDDLIAGDSRYPDAQTQNGYSSCRQNAFSSGRNGARNQMQGDTTEMYVPTKIIGRIIGKGGSKIKEIQLSTGTHIKINDDKTNDETKININGDESARMNAKQIIEELVESGEGMGSNTAQNSFMPSDQKRSPFDFADTAPKSSSVASCVRIDWDLAIQESDRHQMIKWDGYPQIKKNFYIEDPDVANLEPDEVAKIRLENNNIMVQNFDIEKEVVVPNPISTFEEGFAHFPDILSELKRAGFSKPSPIQMQSWPIALQGLDLIGIAQTGTGKTLAFLLPAFIHIEGQPVPREKRMGPNVLVLSPTRELAIQVKFM